MERYLVFAMLAFLVMLQVYSLNLIFQQLDLQTADRKNATDKIMLSNQQIVIDRQEEGRERGVSILQELADIKEILNSIRNG